MAIVNSKRPTRPVRTKSTEVVPELIEIRTGEEMDWARLVDHLRENYADMPSDIEVVQFAGGHANLTYLLRAGDQEYVVRRPPLGPLAKGGHDMGREFRVLSKLHEAYDRAPRAYHLCEDDSVIGAPFFVAERREGEVLRQTWTGSFKDIPDRERRLGFALIDALADLHLVDAQAIGLGNLGRPVGFVERQVHGWAKRWDAAKDREIRSFNKSSTNSSQACQLVREYLFFTTTISSTTAKSNPAIPIAFTRCSIGTWQP